MLGQYLLYLRAYISGAIVNRSSLGAEREIDVVTLALQPLLSSCRAMPCRCGWQSTFPNCTPQSRNILIVFSRGVALAASLLEAPPIPRGKSNECHDEFKMLGIKVSAILETRLLIWISHIYVAFIQVSSRLKCREINVSLILYNTTRKKFKSTIILFHRLFSFSLFIYN